MQNNPFQNFDPSDFAQRFGRKQKNKDNRIYYSKKQKKLLIVIVAIVAVFVLLGAAFNLIMQFIGIFEVGQGFRDVYLKTLFSKIAVSCGGVLLVFAIVLLNLFFVKKYALVHQNNTVLQKRWPYVLAALVFAVFFGRILGDNAAENLLTALHATDFGITDPMFGKDIGYYVFVRPFLTEIVSGLKGLFLFETIFCVIVYFIGEHTFSLRTLFHNNKAAICHIVANILLYYLTMLFSYRFTAENLLYGTFGNTNPVAGAGYIENTIYKNYYTVAPYIVLVCVVAALVFLIRKKWKPAIGFVAAVPAVSVVLFVASLCIQQFVVAPDERTYQTPYIKYNMEATQHAFGLDDIREVQFDIQKESEKIADKEELLNTRILDFNASLTAYNQLQYLRKYYSFSDIDVVPYELNGKQTGVFMSAREINKDNLEAGARSYTNEKFRYTHGFGVAASPFQRVTEDGQPYFCMKDIPVKSTDGMVELKQPRIYYGEETDDYVIVGSENKELDYSEGYEDIEYTYEGDSGVNMSFFKKLLFSVYYRDYKMFFSGNIDQNSKILINRNITERVKMVAPFFRYGNDPQVVVDDNGEIKWILDAYTVTDRYPYAQTYNGINYIRNAAKVVVDAYTGDVTFYVIDESDPIVNTYRKIYPTLFSDQEFPKSLQNHLTVPEDLFTLKSQVYQKYHLTDAGQFYDQSDAWRIATEKYENDEISVAPYFNMFTVDGEEELVMTLPYVLGDKYNMVGILMQRCAPGHYGEMVLYRIPKSETVYGPMQIENKIDNDPDISREMTLWGQGGSTVIRGNLLVIPVENSIFYIEPVYITSKNNASLPEAKRMIVAYKDRIVMKPTLAEAIEDILGLPTEENNSTKEPTEYPTLSNDENNAKIQSVIDAYEAVQESTRQNDWNAFGSNLDALGKAIEALK